MTAKGLIPHLLEKIAAVKVPAVSAAVQVDLAAVVQLDLAAVVQVGMVAVVLVEPLVVVAAEVAVVQVELVVAANNLKQINK